MWAKFGITEMCSGLIDYNWLYEEYKKLRIIKKFKLREAEIGGGQSISD